MTDWMLEYADDYSDLGFDVERHKEAFRRFAESNIKQRSIRAILTAREMLVFGYPGTRFSVRSALDPASPSVGDMGEGCVAVIPLEVADPADAAFVRDDVARYLQRHFPGRCLDLNKPVAVVEDARCVYIALFAPTEDI